MRTKEHIFKHKCGLRLWLLTALLVVMHGFIQAQNMVIIYENPGPNPGTTNSGSGSTTDLNRSAIIPTSAVSFTAQAWGGGGGGGGSDYNWVVGIGGGGGSGAYVTTVFGAGGYTATMIIGHSGARGENNSNAASGTASSVVYNGATIIANGGGGGSRGQGGTGSVGAGGTWSGGSGGSNSGSGGNGGASPNGGAGGSVPSSNSKGYNGYNPGGGGGGGYSGFGSQQPGGHGGGGQATLSYNINALTIATSTGRCQGNTITLTASYGPGTNVTLQWYKDGSPISGATGKTYTITDAQTTHNGSYTVRATYNITYTNANSVAGTSLPTGLSITGGNTLSGTVISPATNITVDLLPVISNSSVTICSGESVNYTPTSGTIPAGTTYNWTLSTVTPAGSINNLPQSGSGSSINLGTLTNTSSGIGVAVYNVTPTAQGCPGTPFTFTVTVYNVPQILPSGTTTICSGETLQLSLDNPMGGTYSSSDPSIAYVNPGNGMLYTDVELINGIPERRPAHSANEGKGGDVTITFTTGNSCVATKTITVTPRTKTPRIRWDYDGICPIDEGEASYLPSDSLNILTPWNSGGVYFANHIVWDSLVINSGYADIDLSQIKWYADEAMTNFVRQGGTNPPAVGSGGQMANFWQNEPHPSEVYWATIATPDSCESRPIRVEVYIRETPEEIDVTDLIGYVQPAGTPSLDLSDYLSLNLDLSQTLEWYATEQDAIDIVNEISEPSPLDPTLAVNEIYWLIKADTFGCRSLPTPFRIKLVPMPKISIEPDTLVCPGEPVTVRINISNGTAPYNFKIINMNSGESDSQTGYDNDIYTFSVNPLSSVVYRISEFSDATTPLVTYAPYGLHTPAAGYFDEAVLSVVVTEITGLTPNSGPTAGGTYTADPVNPIDPAGTVTISGSGFAPFGAAAVSAVTFGGVAVTSFTVIDDNTITCIPPAHASGYVTIAVTTVCATTTLTDGYRYEPINITDVGPAYAPVTGGTSIIIRGTGLLAAAGSEGLVTVTLAGVPAQIISVTNTEIQCITGPSNYSLLDKIVINNGSETREFPKSFTYYPVNFIENGNWSEPHRWETQTADHILPYPNAKIHINANCIQDINVDMDSITVHASKAYTLNNGTVLKANVFTLKENASFLDYNTNNANMQAVRQNVEHLLTKDRNWYISNPVSNSNGLTASSERIEWYSETTHAWESAGGLNIGQGYTIYSASTDMDVQFSGKYNDGDQTYSALTRTTGHSKQGFNLVGNPFPSYWHWTSEAAQQANLYSTIWYRTVAGGVYEFWSYNASGNVAVTPGWEDATPTGSYSLGYIPPMQAFWVRMLDGQTSGTLTFTDNRRSHSDHGSNMLKSIGVNNAETRPLLRIAIDNGLSADETVIYADAKAKKEFDTYDSDKWFVNQGVEIFTLPDSSTRELVINGFPEMVDGTEIPLGFQADEGGSFSFRAKEILNLDTLNVFLSDKWRNIEFDLRAGDYNFTSSSVSGADRFSIVFRSSKADEELSDTESGNDNLLIYMNKDGQMIVTLHLRDRQGSNATISIFDIAGRKLVEEPVVVGEQTILNSILPDGVYILHAEKCTAKVMVKR